MNWLQHKFLTVTAFSVISFVILWGIYGNIMIRPNAYVLSDEGEAARSYYVMTTYLNDGEGWECRSMNYPFGEHLTFCDGQPLTSGAYKVVSSVIPVLKDTGVGFMNVLSLYGLILGGIFLLLFLLELGMARWFAIPLAISLMLLSPQVLRMQWQPALACSFFIPTTIYLAFKAFKSNQWFGWNLIFLLVSAAWYLIHPYLGLMATTYFLVTSAVRWWLDGRAFKWRLILLRGVQIGLPMIVFLAFLSITDSHGTRVGNPDGYVKFSAYLDSVFGSTISPFSEMYHAIYGMTEGEMFQHMDAWAYVGLAGILFSLFFPFRWGLRKWNFVPKRLELPERIKVNLIVSLFLLIVAFSLPYKWFPETINWLEIVPPLKQFRSLGRFAWFFVFAINLAGGYFLYLLIAKSRKKSAQYLFAGAFLAMVSLMAWEGIEQQRFTAKDAHKPNRFSSMGGEKWMAELTVDDYQAIVPIPFFHIGSHRFTPKFEPSNKYMTEALIFAYHTKLPLTGSFQSRNAIEESVKSFQFFADPVIEKRIKEDFGPKPLLIYHRKGMQITEEEKRVLRLGKALFENEEIVLLKLNPQDVFENQTETLWTSFAAYKEMYSQVGNDWLSKKGWVHREYGNNGVLFESQELSTGSEHLLLNTEKLSSRNGKHVLSFWFNHHDGRTNVKLYQRVTDSSTGKVLSDEPLERALRTFNVLEDWMLCEAEVQIPNGQQLEWYFVSTSDLPVKIVQVSRVQLRGEKTSFFEKVTDKQWMWNNRPLSVIEK